MIRTHSTTLALFSLARSSGTYNSIDGIISGVFRFDLFAGDIFFWSIFCIPLSEFKLSFTLETFNEVAHLPDGFILKCLEFGISKETTDLVLHHIVITGSFDAL